MPDCAPKLIVLPPITRIPGLRPQSVAGFRGPLWIGQHRVPRFVDVPSLQACYREDARFRRLQRLRLFRTGLRCLWAAVSGL